MATDLALLVAALSLAALLAINIVHALTARRKHMTRKTKYRFSDYKRSAITPFVLEFDDLTIEIPAPDAETVLRVEEASTSRARVALLCGEHWDEVWERLRGEQVQVLSDLMDDLTEHFHLGTEPGGGRASSR